MGSNIMCLPLHEEARKYIQELKPNEILLKEQPRDLTYEDLDLIFNQLKQWGCCVGINGKASGNSSQKLIQAHIICKTSTTIESE